MKITICISLLLVFFYATLSFAQISPKEGVKPPADFWEFQQMLQSEYSNGYYAEKFRERKQIREKISQGLLPESALVEDTVNALTLMGQYTDLLGHYTQQELQSQLYDGPNPTGTVTDYYSEVSYNQLYFTGDAQGWYNVPGNLQSYGTGSSGGPRFVVEVITDADPTLNFADYIQYYDGQGRPRISFLAIVHAGAGAEAGANNIWSHRWNFTVYSGQPYTTNDVDPVSGQNVIIDGPYAIMPERNGSSNNSGTLIEIGVFAHEFGHIFGIPDLYDTDGSSEGLGNWCLMAGGAWGGNGSSPETPCHMSAWVKKELGWVTPINITSFQEALSVPNVEENPVVYRMWKDALITPEFFLIENRQKIGFDINLYDSGFLIYHVDETRNNNTNEDRYLVDLEQADGFRHLNNGQGRGDAGDPFPGQFENHNFYINTNPNSNAYNLQETFVSVRNIYKNGNMMVGDFDIEVLPVVNLNQFSISEQTPQNGRVEPGEDGDVNFEVENITNLNSNTTVRYFINESGVTVNQNELTVTINAQSTQTVTISNAFTLASDFESRMVQVRYEVLSEGNTVIDSVVLPLGIPGILLLSRAEDELLGDYYKSALLELNNYYEDSYNTDPEYISNREAIIIFMGRNEGDFTQAEIDSFTTYLDNGGNMFFSGANIAEYLEASYTDFLHNSIGITWVGDHGIFTNDAYGVTGDLFGDEFEHIKINGDNGANNDLFVDELSSNGAFNFSLTYNNNGNEPGGGWISNANSSKIFFLGFGFESINNNESSITRTQFLNHILQWFGITTDVISTNNLVITDYVLSQNYPNPFNPSTSIEFSVPVNSNVTLTIYNLLGQVVTTLVNEEVIAGHYSTVWNGADDHGFQVSSGVYLYKMQANGLNGREFQEIRKMVLLK